MNRRDYMKKFTIIIMGIILALGLVGCTPAEVSDSQPASSPVESTTVVVNEDKVVPDRKAEVSGIIKSVIGNEVTVSLILKENALPTTTELSEEEKAAKQAENQAKKDAGEIGSGMTEVELSGEIVQLIIPVGTSVVQSDGTGSFVAKDIGDISKGDTVKIWLIESTDEETNLAEYVQILTR
jgi:3D (Asp-Asp-Asp) domain-containing protein